MRKRKSPIVLVTALAVVVAGVIGFQFASSRPGGNAADVPPPPQVEEGKQVGESRPAVTAQQTSQGLKGLLNSSSSKPTAPPSPEGMGGPGGPQSGPMILNAASPTGKPEKPKPNPSSTSAQWYNSESAMSKDKG